MGECKRDLITLKEAYILLELTKKRNIKDILG